MRRVTLQGAIETEDTQMNQTETNAPMTTSEKNRLHRIERAQRYYRELAEALENNPDDTEEAA